GSGVTAEVTRRVISPRSGHPDTVRATVTVTRPRRMSTRRIMSNSTMLTCNSGSVTGRKASITWSSLSAIHSPFAVAGGRNRCRAGLGAPGDGDLHYADRYNTRVASV